MSKRLDLSKSVYDLCQEYPEIIDIMSELGFSDITKKVALNTMGHIMTIPKGSEIKDIPMDVIISKFQENGFEIQGLPIEKKEENPDRADMLRAYVKRLAEGEELETVRADFVENFSDVEAFEIMQAEQKLMKDGVPFTEVQRLCDVHSALFHGATREEKIANAEKAVAEGAKKQEEAIKAVAIDKPSEKELEKETVSNITIEKREAAMHQAAIVGHPLHMFTKENEAFEAEISKAKELMAQFKENPTDDFLESLSKSISVLRKISIHYAKKGDLLYPHMKHKYEITGPSDVMWSVDDEIRDELRFIDGSDLKNPSYFYRLENVITRMEEMIYKEKNILFPICTRFFETEEWYNIYQDSKDYDECLVEFVKWPEAEEYFKKKNASSTLDGDIIRLPGGHFTPAQLRAVLNTLPIEISFVDENDINCFFNEGPKLFKRAGMAIDRDVFTCHPPKIEMMVRSIISDFKSGARDQVPVWMEKEGIPVLVTYMAVRDENGKYVGTLECVQKMDAAKKYFEK